MNLTSTGGAGFSSSNANYVPGGIGNKPAVLRTMQTDTSNLIGHAGIGGPIRPPLYVPSKRESGRIGPLTSSITSFSA